jgi:hypothetical protein
MKSPSHSQSEHNLSSFVEHEKSSPQSKPLLEDSMAQGCKGPIQSLSISLNGTIMAALTRFVNSIRIYKN